MFRHQASEGHCAHPARRFRDFFASNLYDVNDTRAGTTLWESHYRTSAVLELQMSGNGCQLRRSTQHFVEVYSLEFGILKFFLDADLTAAPLGPDPLAYSRTGQFS